MIIDIEQRVVKEETWETTKLQLVYGVRYENKTHYNKALKCIHN